MTSELSGWEIGAGVEGFLNFSADLRRLADETGAFSGGGAATGVAVGAIGIGARREAMTVGTFSSVIVSSTGNSSVIGKCSSLM